MVVPSSSTVSTPQSTATTVSFGDKFMLTWIYSNNKLFFKLRCKTTGWCAVAFTTGDGSGMKNYDIALGGVASNGNYLDDYWSTSTTKPSKESANNFVLTTASEADGYTTVQFERDPETSDTANDVQFKPGTEVMIAWAMHSSMDGNNDISRHTEKEVLPTKYILVPGAANTLKSRVMLSAILAAIVVYLVS
ncbi:DBH-like monooxygenase protein 1 homolog isoform X1 [Porites lutea]|uniref:DBH-like monooxygenase protein 1 homolog isoform X1 n=1 Tax=Porites lutea TaxID=51062 RepID=UPI003CC5FE2C